MSLCVRTWHFIFLWDMRIWKDSTAVLDRRQSDVMNFRFWTQKRNKLTTLAVFWDMTPRSLTETYWRCKQRRQEPTKVSILVPDNTASIPKDTILNMSILRTPEPQIPIPWHRIIMHHWGLRALQQTWLGSPTKWRLLSPDIYLFRTEPCRINVRVFMGWVRYF